jgi:putative membrane protein
MKRSGFVIAALALSLAAGCNKGPSSKTETGSGATVGTAGRDGGLSSGDRDFIRDIAEMNTADLELGRLGSEHGVGSDVKQFAQMMVTDHTGAADKLNAFASQHAVDVPVQLDDKHRDLRDKLAGKQGLDFDKDYADAMVDAHQDLVDKLESRVDKDTITKTKVDNKNGPDASVKAQAVMPEKSDNPNTQAVNQIAADIYPVAYAHLQAAKALRDGVKKRSTN